MSVVETADQTINLTIQNAPSIIDRMKFARPLRAHQAAVLRRFIHEPEMALLWEMGVGKTTETIAWLRTKYIAAGEVTKTIIITPVATLYNWEEEFKINATDKVCAEVLVPYMRTRKTKYTGSERAAVIQKTDKNIIVVNHEMLDSEECLQALKDFKAVNLVVDEVHKFKSYKLFSGNAKEKKPSRVAKLIAIADRTQNRCIMTGTLILNSYMDCWAPWRILDGGRTLGSNFYTYRNTYFRDKNVGMPKAVYFPNWVPLPGCAELLTEIMGKKSSRIEKSECLSLPPEVEVIRYVEMGKEQSKAYFQMEKDMVSEINAGTCMVMNSLSKRTRMMQILAGHLPVEHNETGEEYVTKFKDNPRLDALRDILDELSANHKVVIWATFASNYPELRALFKELGKDTGWTFAEITGETKGDRQEQILKFREDPNCRWMLSHPKSGGVGVGYQAASYDVRYSYDENLGDWLQGDARTHRGGSEIHKVITHIRLVCKGTVQEPILACLQRKEGDAENIYNAIKKYLADALAK